MSAGRHYSDALICLSKLISDKKRGESPRNGNPILIMKSYIKMLELEEPLKKLNIIHVAGTKGKGSTCAFVECILRSSGYKTALFTSPHLIDVRERFKLGGKDISEELFLNHFWWCYDKLNNSKSADIPMPPYFRFLTLLAFRIFTSEDVDATILEVGLGGRFDSTNTIDSPIVCGITSLGYDHMEILGNTLSQIAFEKAGILKQGVPAFTVPQEEEAMKVLKERANSLNVPLTVIHPSTYFSHDQLKPSLGGEHQLTNANLAVALCRTWIQNSDKGKMKEEKKMKKDLKTDEEFFSEDKLPQTYIKGLEHTSWLGRSQIIHDTAIDLIANSGQMMSESLNADRPIPSHSHVNGKGQNKSNKVNEVDGGQSRLSFFLDGAHSPESLLACARWFSDEVVMAERIGKNTSDDAIFRRILLFNCMPERDPSFILPPLVSHLKNQGLPLHRAIFAPILSSYSTLYNPLISNSISNSNSNLFPTKTNISWQRIIQEKWEAIQSSSSSSIEIKIVSSSFQNISPEFLVHYDRHGMDCSDMEEHERNGFISNSNLNSNLDSNATCYLGNNSILMPSLPHVLNYLRKSAKEKPNLHLQVLVTGSLHLVGDILRLVRP